MRQFYLTLLLLVAVMFNASAQREYNVCDSTVYSYNADTTIVAGKRHLYFQTTAGLSLVHDFTSSDTSEYIRDFDIVGPSQWYVLVGIRYISGPTRLYKSTDKGASWLQDTSFYTASRFHPTSANNYYRSVNQLQRIGRDTIILFIGYYESGLVYSIDGGNTWQQWFRNLITHYQGFLECGNKYYLYGFQGDAFSPWMFPIDKSMLFSPDTAGAWRMFSDLYHPRCSGTVHPDCIYPTPYLNRCGQYTYMKNYVDSICALNIGQQEQEKHNEQSTSILPNPNNGRFVIAGNDIIHSKVSVRDIMGRQINIVTAQLSNGHTSVQLPDVPKGLYTVLLTNDSKVTCERILIE